MAITAVGGTGSVLAGATVVITPPAGQIWLIKSAHSMSGFGHVSTGFGTTGINQTQPAVGLTHEGLVVTNSHPLYFSMVPGGVPSPNTFSYSGIRLA